MQNLDIKLNKKFRTEIILGYPVYSEGLTNIKLEGFRRIINTINAYSYVLAKNDISFKQALFNSNILLPDGFPIVLASRILYRNKTMTKIAGYEVFCQLMKELNLSNGKCFFLGATDHTLQKIQANAIIDYPNVRVKTFSPPYKSKFSEEDNAFMLIEINSYSPDVLFIGMTAPKQEKWVDENINQLNVGTVCSIGAVFDFYAGTIARPNKIWIKLGLEWFIRLVKEPKRLWKRYLVFSPIYFIDLMMVVLKLKKF